MRKVLKCYYPENYNYIIPYSQSKLFNFPLHRIFSKEIFSNRFNEHLIGSM